MSAPDNAHGITYLLSKLGFHVGHGFMERIEPLGLQPPHVGILRLVDATPGQSQQAIAKRIGIAPNRLVGMIDELEQRGLLRRERSAADRRVHELQLTPAGGELLAEAIAISAAHELEICAALDDEEREQLASLLRRVAEQQGIPADVHPAIRKALG